MSQLTLLLALQEHDGSDAVRVTFPGPPPCGAVLLVAPRVKEQAVVPACVIVTVWFGTGGPFTPVSPAIVKVPVRLVALVLASTL
jgi:hypothetical protein